MFGLISIGHGISYYIAAAKSLVATTEKKQTKNRSDLQGFVSNMVELQEND